MNISKIDYYARPVLIFQKAEISMYSIESPPCDYPNDPDSLYNIGRSFIYIFNKENYRVFNLARMYEQFFGHLPTSITIGTQQLCKNDTVLLFADAQFGYSEVVTRFAVFVIKVGTIHNLRPNCRHMERLNTDREQPLEKEPFITAAEGEGIVCISAEEPEPVCDILLYDSLQF